MVPKTTADIAESSKIKIDIYENGQDPLSLIEERHKETEPAMVLNVDTLLHMYDQWKTELPSVKPFYAYKSNPDPVLVRTMAALGAGFDCASKVEIEEVLAIGVAPERILFANTNKPKSHIRYAAHHGIHDTVFDSVEELHKVHAIDKDARFLLRIEVFDHGDRPISRKYGSHHRDHAPHLLHEAKKIGANVVGVCFYVGVGKHDTIHGIQTAIGHAREVFDEAATLGMQLKIVDIGGGFDGRDEALFKKTAHAVRNALAENFSEMDVQVIAEPGRYFAAPVCSLLLHVIHKTKVNPKDVPAEIHGLPDDEDTLFLYYVNDGIFGSFNRAIMHNVKFHGRPLKVKSDDKQYPCIIWGPTCDNADRIEGGIKWRALEVGDVIVYDNMGAYSTSTGSTFNGFPLARYHHVATRNAINHLASLGLDVMNIELKPNLQHHDSSDLLQHLVHKYSTSEVIAN